MSTAITMLSAYLDGDAVTLDAIVARVDDGQLARELFFLALHLGRLAADGDDQLLRRSLSEALIKEVRA